MKKVHLLYRNFLIPVIVLVGIITYLLFSFFNLAYFSLIIVFVTMFLGSYDLFKNTIISILKKHFALDYIAVLAIIVSLITKEYLVGAVIALMLSSGRALEAYGVSQAKNSLTKLIDRIPNEVTIWKENRAQGKKKVEEVKIGELILIKKGEVVAVDGILHSENGLTDESSLTGEPYTIEKIKGDSIRSGTINIGDPIVVRVIKLSKDSAYKKIIDMVRKAQQENAPLVRIADKYSAVFTIVTLFICAGAFLATYDLSRVLSILVIATPCPLILATPIALLGGVNAAAKRRIIVKKLAAVEILSRADTFIFDKTGTITLGRPRLVSTVASDPEYDKKTLLAIAEAIERNSLHPLAKAIVVAGKEEKVELYTASLVKEIIGSGISGVVNKKEYVLQKEEREDNGMTIAMFEKNKRIGEFVFEDEIKKDSADIFKKLKQLGLSIHIFTGDKKRAAEQVIKQLGDDTIKIKSECTPEDKLKGIELFKKQKKTTVMVGDGINDAPALALADVGIVFSNDEQTAASEAADIVLLGNEFEMVYDSISISKRTVSIAIQSILWGIGISVGGMFFAAFGLIPPLLGAALQEAIDVATILNALRASK